MYRAIAAVKGKTVPVSIGADMNVNIGESTEDKLVRESAKLRELIAKGGLKSKEDIKKSIGENNESVIKQIVKNKVKACEKVYLIVLDMITFFRDEKEGLSKYLQNIVDRDMAEAIINNNLNILDVYKAEVEKDLDFDKNKVTYEVRCRECNSQICHKMCGKKLDLFSDTLGGMYSEAVEMLESIRNDDNEMFITSMLVNALVAIKETESLVSLIRDYSWSR